MTSIEKQIYEYRAAQVSLDIIHHVNEESRLKFAEHLQTISDLQDEIDAWTKSELARRGVQHDKKKFEAAQKKARKELFSPALSLWERQQESFEGKTKTMYDADLTLVQQKDKLVPADTSLDAHKHDVQLLLDNNMWRSLEVVADEDTLSWMRLREKNEEESLTSVKIEPQGYVKVGLK